MEDDDIMKSLRRKSDLMEEENEKAEVSDENNDLFEDAYKIAIVRKQIEIMRAELNKKAKERGMNETQVWSILAMMKLQVDEELRNKKEN